MAYKLKNFDYWTNSYGKVTSIKMKEIELLRWPLKRQLSEKYLTKSEIQDITTNLAHSFQFLEFIVTFKSEGCSFAPIVTHPVRLMLTTLCGVGPT